MVSDPVLMQNSIRHFVTRGVIIFTENIIYKYYYYYTTILSAQFKTRSLLTSSAHKHYVTKWHTLHTYFHNYSFLTKQEKHIFLGKSLFRCWLLTYIHTHTGLKKKPNWLQFESLKTCHKHITIWPMYLSWALTPTRSRFVSLVYL